MIASNVVLFWVVLYRTMQAGLETVPTLLCGLVIAGLIRGMIGGRAVRRWITDDSLIGPIRAALIGLLLPVCSFGVLPIAWELRRSGIRRATVLTFLLAAPVADPLSLISAMQQLESQGWIGLGGLVFFLIAAILVTTGTGILLGYLLPEPAAEQPAPLPDSGVRRVAIVVLTLARGLTTTLFPIVIIGLIGSGLLAIIPEGALARAADDRSVTAPLHMVAVATPFYAPPGYATAMVCELLMSGSTLGIAFVFFQLGVGLNLGTLTWIGRCFGLRYLIPTILIFGGAVVALGYAVPLSQPNLRSERGRVARFFEIEPNGGIKAARLRAIRLTLTDDMGQTQWFLVAACVALGTITFVGVISHAVGETGTITYWVTSKPKLVATEVSSSLNRHLTPPQVALVTVAVIVAVVGSGLFVFYPPPPELFNQIEDLQLELALTLKADPVPLEQAIRLASQLQRHQRRIAVAAIIRQGKLPEGLRTANENLRAAIDGLRSELSQGASRTELQPLSLKIRETTTQCRESLKPSRPR